jgi:flagellar L-ring protein precursor FlgH
MNSSRTALLATFVCSLVGFTALAGHCENLQIRKNFSALAADRLAESTGDTITILIQERASASGSEQNSRSRSGALNAQLQSTARSNALGGSISGSTSGVMANQRTATFTASVTATVDDVLDNGDLHIHGDEYIDINGETTHLQISGRVRRADISTANTVPSSAIADLSLRYGAGSAPNKRDQRGLIGRLFGLIW